MTEISYGASILGAFGAPGALQTFAPQTTPDQVQVDTPGRPPPIHEQGKAPICSAIAALTLLQFAGAGRGLPAQQYHLPFTYFGALRLVETTGDAVTVVRQQASSGVPLAAALQSLCQHGVVVRTASGDPWKDFLAFDAVQFDALAGTDAFLPWPCRAFRLFPSVEQVRLALHNGHAVAFSFQIDANIDAWMRDTTLQSGSSFVLPRPTPFGTAMASHACVVVGADDVAGLVKVRNSFGPAWGKDGHFFIDYNSLHLTSFSNNEFFILS